MSKVNRNDNQSVFVIDGGGRGHALVHKLAQSPRVSKIWCAPGNYGIGQEQLTSNDSRVQCVNIAANDVPKLLAFAEDAWPSVTVVGTEVPLGLGIVDLFQKRGLRIWGPNQKAAMFETSKCFTQDFAARHNIPIAYGNCFDDPERALTFAATILGGRCAVKADGIHAGKGVEICHTIQEAETAIIGMLVNKSCGDAGKKIVIQELLEGTEISLHAACDGRTSRLFPTSKDHKRALHGDRGKNTGGMGAYSPTKFVDESLLMRMNNEIIAPWLLGCTCEDIDYRGIIYPGIMLTKGGPRLLEFNARFGDPETQVYLTRLATDLLDIIDASLDNTLDDINICWKSLHSFCVVIASGGYPDDYEKGKVITGLDAVAQLTNVKVFHAGTAHDGDNIVTNGGRVLGVTAWASTAEQARNRAYEAAAIIDFEGKHYRDDL